MSANVNTPTQPTATPPTAAATRDAYGKALAELGAERKDIVVLDADLSGSTKTNGFAKAFPERFFNIGVAEANMTGIAAGLSFSGLTVFCSSFAMFSTGKAYEQVRQEVALPNADVKVCATHAGLTVGEDGASHQMLEDLALMRVLPNMRVFVPADGREAEQVIRAVAASKGPAYVRLSRMKTPLFMPAGSRFEIGVATRLREGDSLTLIGTGVTTWHALQAATLLAAAEETAGIVTVEEAQAAGGLGGAVAEVVTSGRPCPVVRLGMRDRFGESGDGLALLEHFGLTAPHIARAARELLAKT